MKKSFLILSLILLTSSLLPAEGYKAQAYEQLQRAHAGLVQGKNRIQHLWFCFRNPSQCSEKEAALARKWIYNAGAAAVVTALATTGIVMGTNRFIKMRDKAIL